MSKLREQVLEFHRAMGVPVRERPTRIPEDRVRLRLALIAEEFAEFCAAIGRPIELPDFEATWNGGFDMAQVADALADLDYVIEGARLEFGIDGGPVADEVHRSNMAKVNGPIRSDGKRLKPEGWTPPDIAGVLKAQGWEG
jgi:predicted HAD superfamily Cof-like phosphohydrolase